MNRTLELLAALRDHHVIMDDANQCRLMGAPLPVDQVIDLLKIENDLVNELRGTTVHGGEPGQGCEHVRMTAAWRPTTAAALRTVSAPMRASLARRIREHNEPRRWENWPGGPPRMRWRTSARGGEAAELEIDFASQYMQQPIRASHDDRIDWSPTNAEAIDRAMLAQLPWPPHAMDSRPRSHASFPERTRMYIGQPGTLDVMNVATYRAEIRAALEHAQATGLRSDAAHHLAMHTPLSHDGAAQVLRSWDALFTPTAQLEFEQLPPRETPIEMRIRMYPIESPRSQSLAYMASLDEGSGDAGTGDG